MEDYQKWFRNKKEEQIRLWKKTVKKIFSAEIDKEKYIFGKKEIIRILNLIGESHVSDKVSNHTFLPSGGGLDLLGAKDSFEEDKIELTFEGHPYIVKPEVLKFYANGDNPEWWYFRLNTSAFEDSGVYEKSPESEFDSDIINKSREEQLKWRQSFRGEELVELEPEEYVDRSYWEMNFYGYDESGDEVPLPETARLIVRKHTGGSFVIFSKFSFVNHMRGEYDAYDALHNKLSEQDYNLYIKELEKND